MANEIKLNIATAVETSMQTSTLASKTNIRNYLFLKHGQKLLRSF